MASAHKPFSNDIGGAIVYEAESLDHAVALAKRSPGLKYGFSHEVFPEISLSHAAVEKVSTAAGCRSMSEPA
jgi:hypothetical protein